MDYFHAMRAFLAAAEMGSFSKAARHMQVETSTLSRYISELEKDLGIALFNRSTRGLVLTEGGHVFRQRAQDVIERLDEARNDTSALNQSPRGQLRIGVPRAFALTWLVPRLKIFSDHYPRIDIDMVFSDSILNLIEADLDVAFRLGVLGDSQLMARKLAPHRRILCAAPALLEQHARPTSPRDLAAIPAVTPAGNVQRDLHLVGADGNSAALVLQSPPRFRVDDTEAALQMALAGCGIAVLPHWRAHEALEQHQLVRLLPTWELIDKPGDSGIWLVYTRKKTVSSKVRAFVDFFASEFAAQEAALWG